MIVSNASWGEAEGKQECSGFADAFRIWMDYRP
jgi:hypothetical protein